MNVIVLDGIDAQIQSLMLSEGILKCSVLYNGYLIKSNGCNVNVETDNKKSTVYHTFINHKSYNGETSTVDVAPIKDFVARLQSKRRYVKNLTDVQIKNQLLNSDQFEVSIYHDLSLIVIKDLWFIAGDLAVNGVNSNQDAAISGMHLICKPGQSGALLAADYTEYMLHVYDKTVLGESIFTTKLKPKDRLRKFYSTFKMYVPCLVDVDFLYNPLLHDNAFLRSDLYKTAKKISGDADFIKSGAEGSIDTRKVSVGPVSYVLLTHLEICKALHMDKFVRFTASMLYELVTGLTAISSSFPRADNVLYSYSGANKISLNSFYTDEDFVEVYNYYKDSFDKLQGNLISLSAWMEQNDETNAEYSDKAGELEKYKAEVAEIAPQCAALGIGTSGGSEFSKIDSLASACDKWVNYINNYNITVYDTKVQRADLEEYLRAAKL